MLDWAAWRARTGGVDGRLGAEEGPPSADPSTPSADPSTASPETDEDEHADRVTAGSAEAAQAAERRWSGRTGVAVVAIVAAGALLGGLAAFAARLGGPAPSPAPAPSIAPGHVTGTLAPVGAGVGPRHARSGGAPPGATPPGATPPGATPPGASGHGNTGPGASGHGNTGPGATGPGNTGLGRPEPSLSPISEPAGRPISEPTGRPISEPTGRPTAGDASATKVDPHADPFSAAVTGYLSGRAGTVAAAIYDVTTGQTWTLGAGGPQATGSLVKVDILQALLARRPSGLTVADQTRARSMIESNDNASATTLWNQAGRAAGLRSFNASVGLRQTTPSACLVCAGFAWPGWGLTTTTPADQLILLRELIHGPLLSPADRGYALSLLENVEPDQRWGVSGGVPPGVRVTLKSAWVPLTPADTDWQVNSEGWISGDGRDYLIAVLTTGNPDEQYGIDTINTMSALLWPAMG